MISAPPDLMHGMALGRQEAGIDRLIYITEMHGRTLEVIAGTQAKMADTLERLEERATTPPAPKAPEPMTARDKLQLAAAALAALAVMSGRLPLKEALALFGKPFGF